MLQADEGRPPRERKGTMDYRLELVPIPVSDVVQAKAFYAEKVGSNVDLDVNADTDQRVRDERRVVQLTAGTRRPSATARPPGRRSTLALTRTRPTTNFMMDEGQERVKATYRDNYERLVATKNKYDPTNLFRVNQNIRPTATV
jgi:hypothetical protein